MKKLIIPFVLSLLTVCLFHFQSANAQLSDVEQSFQSAAIAALSENGSMNVDEIEIRRINVTSDDRYALVDWIYGPAGGVTLLEKKGEEIEVLTQGGGALLRADLEHMGISPESAAELLPEDEF
jgi:hypothetical protein